MLTATGPVSLSSEQLPSVSTERAANKIAENRMTEYITVLLWPQCEAWMYIVGIIAPTRYSKACVLNPDNAVVRTGRRVATNFLPPRFRQEEVGRTTSRKKG